MSARLHVMLGDGGVGKTTLSGAYALALAHGGRRVALLGVDPARRLQTALGLSVGDAAAPVPVAGSLSAAHLVPEVTLRRWATEGLADDVARARVLGNPFFGAIADRLATTTDIIGAVRAAEWLESDPSLTDLVIDTAPGRSGIDLLVRPDALLALGRGHLVRWVQSAQSGRDRGVFGIGRRVLGGIGRITGAGVVAELADLVVAANAPAQRFAVRLERARALLRAPETELVVVVGVHADAVRRAEALCAAITATGLRVSTIAINGTLPRSACLELASTRGEVPPAARGVLSYARAHLAYQSAVEHGARQLAPRVVELPYTPALDGVDRLARLATLGEALLTGGASRGARLRSPQTDGGAPAKG